MRYDDVLTTGQAARLLHVTPDTVLKWIKRGLLPASQTAGGHYRVARRALKGLLPASPVEEVAAATSRPLLYCWEYYASNGDVGETCRECLVYRARALRCYEMSRLSRESGFSGTYCKTSCDDCPYYLDQLRGERRVLVVTDSVRLRERLATEAKDSRLRVRFASCEDECASAIDEFLPHYVVIDCMLPGGACHDLCSHLACDERVRGVQVILAAGAEERRARLQEGRDIDSIPRSFSIGDLERHIAGSGGAGEKEVLQAESSA